MKIQLHYLTFGLGIVVATSACNDQAKIPNLGKNLAIESSLLGDNSLQQQPAGTVLQFLKWYRSNDDRIKKIQLATPSKSRGGLAVNTTGTDQFLSEMQKSGFISDKYMAYMRQYFQKCDDALKSNLQKTGPVKGLDIDLVMWSKDYEEDLAKIEKSTVEYQKIEGDQAIVTIGLPTVGRIKYKISKQNGKWIIDEIKDIRSALDQAQND